MSDLITPLLDWIGQNPLWSGGVIFLVAMLESLAIVGVLVPGALMMVGFGALIANETLLFWPTVGWAIAGAVVGDGISFLIGCHFSDRTATIWPFTRHPMLLQRGFTFFQRHGSSSVILGRFVGPIRAVIPLIAGMMGMSPQRFLLANLLSAAIWAPLYLLPGIALGMAFGQATALSMRLVTLGLLLFLFCWSLLWLLKRFMSANSAKRLIALLLLMVVAGNSYLYWQPGYSPKERHITLQQAAWWQQDWQQLPQHRSSPIAGKLSQFNIQLYGDLVQIGEQLEAQGWQLAEPLKWQNLLKLLSAELTASELPTFTMRESGQSEALLLQQSRPDGGRSLLRLWPSQFHIAEQTIWLGIISSEQPQMLLNLISLPGSELSDPSHLSLPATWSSRRVKEGALRLIDTN